VLTILVRKVGVFVFEREKTRSAKVFKSSERQLFFRKGRKSFAIIYIFDVKKENKCQFSFNEKLNLKNYTTEKSMPLIPYNLALQPDH